MYQNHIKKKKPRQKHEIRKDHSAISPNEPREADLEDDYEEFDRSKVKWKPPPKPPANPEVAAKKKPIAPRPS